MTPILKVFTTSEAETKHFHASSGNAYTTFSSMIELSGGERTAGPKQFLIRTTELDEFVEIAIAARDAWRKAKDVEKQNNSNE